MIMNSCVTSTSYNIHDNITIYYNKILLKIDYSNIIIVILKRFIGPWQTFFVGLNLTWVWQNVDIIILSTSIIICWPESE